VKTVIVALSAALMSVAPAAFARAGSSKTPALQHHVAKQRHPGVAGVSLGPERQAKGSNKGPYRRHPDAFGYAPGAPSVSDRDFIQSRQFGGGGGGSM
jgi:hypothetical protein